MKWYDFFAGFYDNALEKLYFKTRQRAVEVLDVADEQTVLDVACCTGANFPHLFATGKAFRLYATDFSEGMLKRRTTGCRKMASTTFTYLRPMPGTLRHLP